MKLWMLFIYSPLLCRAAGAAVEARNLAASGNGADLASYSFTLSPVPNQPHLAAVVNSKGATPPNIPVLSGNNLTWSLVATVTYRPISAPLRRVTLFSAIGQAPTAGELVVSFGGIVQDACAIIVDTFAGADGTGAVIESVTAQLNGTTSISAQLAVDTAAAVYAVTGLGYHIQPAVNNIQPQGAGWTELAEREVTWPYIRMQSMFRADFAQPATQFVSNDAGMIAVTIRPAPAGPVTTSRNVSLAWDLPATLSGIDHYEIGWGRVSRSYEFSAAVPGGQAASTYVVVGLGAGTWYLAVRAVGPAGSNAMSDYSNEVTLTIVALARPENLRGTVAE